MSTLVHLLAGRNITIVDNTGGQEATMIAAPRVPRPSAPHEGTAHGSDPTAAAAHAHPRWAHGKRAPGRGERCPISGNDALSRRRRQRCRTAPATAGVDDRRKAQPQTKHLKKPRSTPSSPGSGNSSMPIARERKARSLTSGRCCQRPAGRWPRSRCHRCLHRWQRPPTRSPPRRRSIRSSDLRRSWGRRRNSLPPRPGAL